jgi:hypothetical protein
MNPGIDATLRLAHLGYRFTVNGEAIKARYEGPGDPDPAQVPPCWMWCASIKRRCAFS